MGASARGENSASVEQWVCKWWFRFLLRTVFIFVVGSILQSMIILLTWLQGK